MKTPAILSDGTAAEYCGGLMTHKLHGLDVFGHGGADAAYRGQVSCIPEKELEVILLSNTTTRVMAKMADKAACIVLGLPDCTEPAVPEHKEAPAHAGLFAASLPDDPLFVNILDHDGTLFMKREWCETELVRTEDGGYRVGTLDEVIYFTEEGILYRLPARVVKMTPVSPADPSLFEEGHYYDEETDAHVTLEKTENGCGLCMLRYGKSELYRNAAGENIFSFGPDLTMYVKPENGSIILDGGRIKNIVLKKMD